MSIKDQPYSNFPINPIYMNLRCCQCNKWYENGDYAKSYVDGDPLYMVQENSGEIKHFCGAGCSNKYFEDFTTGKRPKEEWPKSVFLIPLEIV